MNPEELDKLLFEASKAWCTAELSREFNRQENPDVAWADVPEDQRSIFCRRAIVAVENFSPEQLKAWVLAKVPPAQ